LRPLIQKIEKSVDLMFGNELDRRGVRGTSICGLDQAPEFLQQLAEEALQS
jgi:hypothetical protein